MNFSPSQIKEFKKTEDFFKNKYDLSIHPCSRLGSSVAAINHGNPTEEINRSKKRKDKFQKIINSNQKHLRTINKIFDCEKMDIRKLIHIEDFIPKSPIPLYEDTITTLESLNKLLTALIKVENDCIKRKTPTKGRQKDSSGNYVFALFSVLICDENKKVNWKDIDTLLGYYTSLGPVYLWLKRYTTKYKAQDAYEKAARSLRVKKIIPSDEEREHIINFYKGMHELSCEFLNKEHQYLNDLRPVSKKN